MIDKFTDGKVIRVDTFDMSEYTQMNKKVDLLYYNTINQDGLVLRSLVHVSDTKALDDDSQIIYDNTYLLSNVYVPDGFGVDMTWTCGGEFSSGLNFNKLVKPKDNTISTHDKTIAYAPTLGNDVVMYDGWYTLVSFAPQHLSSYHHPTGVLGEWAEIDGDIMYAAANAPEVASEWQSIYSIPEQNIEVYCNINRYGAAKSEDFFVLNQSLAMYSDLLLKKMDGEWYTQVTSIKPKIRTLQSKIEQKDYAFAQYILNSMDYALISQLI